MTTLTNDFHHTTANTRWSREDLDKIRWRDRSEWSERERAVAYRLWKQLCGIKGCTCGDLFGER